MSSRKLLLSFVSLLAFCTVSFSQSNDFTKTIATRFSKLWLQLPQEKVYLHTDKPFYSAGEEIWFKAYLVNASTLFPNTQSRFIYTELVDQSDSVICRVKIRKDSLGFRGHIKLQPELMAGTYMLRAYTYWMQNVPADYFFKKRIQIGNGIDDRINCDVKFGTFADGKLPVSLSFSNTFKSPLTGKAVIINQTWIKTGKPKFSQTTDDKGKISLSIPYNLTDSVKRILEVSITEPGTKFKNKIILPELSKDFDVQFLPESGVFLSDELQSLAFKAIGKNGLGIHVTGTIFNNANEQITDFTSVYKGMGKISIKTNPGESYYALVTSDDGIQKKYLLPAPSETGISLNLTYNRGKINYQIANKSGKQDSSLSLMIHSRGVVYVVLPLANLTGQVTESLLPAGVASFSVIDSTGNVYCERLVFIKNMHLPIMSMSQDKPFYGKRAPVQLGFTITDEAGKPLQGNFSVSVTDSKFVPKDTVNDNILTYLLLSSDLKGYIEEPALYFSDNKPATREKLDLLMCTQGWRRFSTANLAKGQLKTPDFYLEAGQAVSGKVLNLLNKPSTGCDIIMFSTYKNRIAIEKTDSVGRFLITGIEFPDSTSLILKAKSKTKLVDVELIPDMDYFPKLKEYFPIANSTSMPSADYLLVSKEKYYNDGGMLMVNLDEFTVNADARRTKASETRFYSGMADNEFTAEKLEQYPGYSIFDILSMTPGVVVNGETISIRGSQGNPLFMVDGIETERIEDISYLNSSDLENISVFKGANTAIFGSKGGNGVVAIELKKGVVRQAQTPPSLAHIMPLGFQKPAEFYVPKYEVDSIRNLSRSDLRTTIYWNPSVVTDVNGNCQLKFYTADRANHYNVELEGIGPKGEICRFSAVIRRED